MINAVSPEIGTKIREERLRKGLKNVNLHSDHAPCYNSGQKADKTDRTGLSRIPHPPYISDISPCDFWLFDFLQEQFKGTQRKSSKQALDPILAILAEIPNKDFIAVSADWIERGHRNRRRISHKMILKDLIFVSN
jgi:hypothetical protein